MKFDNKDQIVVSRQPANVEFGKSQANVKFKGDFLYLSIIYSESSEAEL